MLFEKQENCHLNAYRYDFKTCFSHCYGFAWKKTELTDVAQYILIRWIIFNSPHWQCFKGDALSKPKAYLKKKPKKAP